MLVAGAFRTAYAHSQSPSMSTRQLSHAAIDTPPSPVSDELCHIDEPSTDRRKHRRQTDTRNQLHQPTSDVRNQLHQSVDARNQLHQPTDTRNQLHQPSDIVTVSKHGCSVIDDIEFPMAILHALLPCHCIA